MVRKVKVLRFTVNLIDEIESVTNNTLEELYKKGYKVVTIQTETFGLSPMWYIVNIIYEIPEKNLETPNKK
jgi:hypothetical protein